MPGPLPAMVTHVEVYSAGSQPDFCDIAASPVGEGSGNVAIPFRVFARGWKILSPSGAALGGVTLSGGDLFPQFPGFIGYANGDASQRTTRVDAFDPAGNRIGSSTVVGGVGDGSFAPDPNGGLFMVGHFAMSLQSPPPKNRVALMINRNGTVRYGPVPFPSEAAIFGLGVDLKGRAMVVLAGGAGTISSVWLESDGKPMTGVFTVLSGFQPGSHTWFETSPLASGGLALRRMDAPSEREDEHRRTSQWVAMLA